MKLYTTLGLGLAFTLSSCLDHSETINLKNDGSGTIVEETILGAQASQMIDMMAQQGGGKGQLFNQESAKKRAAALGEGVTVESVTPINKDGKKGAKMVFHFNNINTVTLDSTGGMNAMQDMMPQGMPGMKKPDVNIPKYKFTFQDKTLTVTMPRPDKEALQKLEEKNAGKDEIRKKMQSPEMKEIMKGMFADMKMAMHINVESGIDDTNAKFHDDHNVTISEVDFSKLMGNEKFISMIGEVDPKNPSAMAEKIKSIDGIKAEDKETFTIKVK